MKGKCSNSVLCAIISIILLVVGIYSLILGIKTQWMSDLMYNNWMAMLYYLVAIILIGGVKMHMYKVHMK